MDKSLGTLLRFWGVFQFTQVQPLPSPHKQCWTRVSRIFWEIQLCIGWGEGELQEHFENDAVLRGSREMTEKYAYCSTVPRTFVQDCRFDIVWVMCKASLICLVCVFSGYFKDDLLCHFGASMISGLATTLASMPVDIAKTRYVHWPTKVL